MATINVAFTEATTVTFTAKTTEDRSFLITVLSVTPVADVEILDLLEN